MGRTPTTILCIDDAPQILLARQMLLRSAGFSVITAPSGGDGVKMFATTKVDAVVIDYQMPDLDGESVADELRKQDPSIPLVLITGYADPPPTVIKKFDSFLGSSPQLLVKQVERLVKLRQRTLQPTEPTHKSVLLS